ncbi:MAG TPA: DNA polymerase III subunit beta [Candidatus Atribacteria bacterium]|nr:DNA polymerase III subunit beta [Candidatus Atribacteria bacterium]HPT78707.1 DNA polymerase III subunit beta [Candidatus Atribacteria bacterium]
MKIKCNQNIFLSSVLTVQKAASARTTLPVLEGILVQTDKDHIKLTGTNLELGIECRMEAEVLSPGSVVIPSKLLSEIVRKLPDSVMEVSLLDNYAVRIKCLNSTVTIQGLPPEEFPELPSVDGGETIEVNQLLLSDMIRQTIFAVAVDESRPILTGGLLEVDGNSINMVCLDGYRLALRTGRTEMAYEGRSVVIPGRSLSEISKILDNEDKNIRITISARNVLFDLGNTKVVTRVLDGEFINYRQIIPGDYKTRVKVDTSILSASIERASLIAREGKNNLIKLNIQDTHMVITSNSEAGQIYEEIPILLEGRDLEIAFNARYFLDILKVLDDQEICLDFTTNVSPCIVRPIDGDQYTYLLLPVRIYS